MFSEPKSKSFVQKTLRVTRRQKFLFDVYMAGLLPQTVRFAVHVIASCLSLIRRWEPTGAPISATFIQRHFREAEISVLVNRGVIVVEEFDRADGKSREFRLTGPFALAFLQAGPRLKEAGREMFVDLATGEASRSPPKSIVTDPDRNAAPSLVRQAIESVTTSPVNVPAMAAHVARLKMAYTDLPPGPEKARAASRYLADLSCFNTVLANGARPTGVPADGVAGEIWEYTPSYHQQRFGRVSEAGGGCQNASRALKAAARSGVPGFRNYDMEASQMRLLVVEMRRAGIEPTWATEYLANPNAKHEAAARTGLSVEAWKRCIYGVLMGARVPTPGQVAFSSGRITETIRQDVGDEAFDDVYKRLYEYVAPLLAAIKLWHDHLEGPWVEANGRRSNSDGRVYVRNAVGATVAVDDLAVEGKPFKLRSRLAAFVLQGDEAAVAHRLAHAYSQTGRVLSLEHDGLIVIGEIDEAVVRQAVREAGLPCDSVILVEKPLD